MKNSSSLKDGQGSFHPQNSKSSTHFPSCLCYAFGWLLHIYKLIEALKFTLAYLLANTGIYSLPSKPYSAHENMNSCKLYGNNLALFIKKI